MEGGLQPSPTTLGTRQHAAGRVRNEINAGKTGRMRPKTKPRTLPQTGGDWGLRSSAFSSGGKARLSRISKQGIDPVQRQFCNMFAATETAIGAG
jgi:hypothetical protein